jgi:hypothetical protein
MAEVFLQVPSQIFVAPLARIGEPISYPIDSDIHISVICRIDHIALLLLVLISFRVIDLWLTHGLSKLATEFD